MKDEHETEQRLTNESAELRQRIAELETVETGDQRAEDTTRWSRMWLSTAGMFVLLCILVWLNEVLDIPHLLLGAPRTPINWQEAIIETILVLTIGLLAVFRLIHDITERKRAEERIEHLNSVLRAIRNVNQLIVRERDRDRLLQGACDRLIETRYYNAWIVMLDEAGGLVTTAEAGLDQEFLPIVERLERGELTDCARRALAQAGVLVTDDPSSTCTDCPLSGTYAGQGAMTVRLECGGKVYGLLTISIPEDRVVDEEDQSLLKEIAGDIALGLHSIELEDERKQAEEALRESEERYRDLIESTYDMIQSVAPDGRFVFVNQAWLETLGYTEAELPSLNLWKIIHPESLPHCQQVFSRVMDGEPIRNVQATFVAKDGRSILVEGNVTGRYVGGRLIATHGFFRDITERKRAEEALKEAQRYTRGLIEANLDALVTISVEGNISDVNRATELITGMSRQEIVGTDFSNYFTDPGAAREGYQQVFRDGHVRDYPLEIKHRDGKIAPVVYNASVYKDARGRVAGVFAAARDITDRKRAEEALRQYAERLGILHEIDQAILAAWSPEEIAQAACERIRRLVPCQRASIAVFDLEADQAIVLVADVNAESHIETGRHMPLTAYSALDVVRRDPVRYVEDIRALPERPPVVQQLLAEGIRSYVSAPLIAGDWLIGEISLGAISPGAFDEQHLEITREVADQLAVGLHQARLRSALEAEQKRLEALVEHLPEGILLLNGERRILLSNPAAETYLRVLTDATVGDVLTYLADRPVEELLQSPLEGLWHELEVAGPPRRVFEVVAQPMAAETGAGGWVLVVRDVTRKREMQRYSQQQERLATVGQLAAGIAHDFNNIMATIILYAHTLSRIPALSPRDRERLATVNQQAMHATNLIQQILDFSRRAVLKRQPLDLSPLLKEQVKMLARTLPESIEIDLAYGPALSGAEGPGEFTVNADPTRMQQVVMNLAVNARDAMPDGGNLRFGLERIWVQPGELPPLPEMEAGEWIQVTVSDTGTGIPPDTLPHIFDPFFTTKAPGEGSGLGLAQVYGIVKQHEGEIDVQSPSTTLKTGQVGQGTTFMIYLPALPVHPTEPPTLELPSLAQGRGETILVVEDDAAMRQALVDSMQLLNYRVLAAANGREALAILERHGDDPSTSPSAGSGQRSGQGVALVLSDVVMPRMGGIALLHALKQSGLTVPVVLLTGHPLEKELEELQAQGLSGWLLKPPRLEHLAQMIARALKEQ